MQSYNEPDDDHMRSKHVVRHTDTNTRIIVKQSVCKSDVNDKQQESDIGILK